jgi:hypothetical protein
VLDRFEGVIDAIAEVPAAKRITHILIGNEVDSYLAQHTDEIPAFEEFYRRAIARIHEKLPGVKVGTIITFGSVRSRPGDFVELIKAGDFVAYTYYPVTNLSRGDVSVDWQMVETPELANHIGLLAALAADKPFAFTEIGYSSSALNASSEKQQARFVRQLFRVLDPYFRRERVAFVLYNSLYDEPSTFCRPYANEQKIQASREFCSFVENLGLRSQAHNEPREAWHVFVEEMEKRKHPTRSNRSRTE